MILIKARVSGGVTGTREGWLKLNGEILQFATREDADKEAAHLNKTMNNEHSVADFRYTVVDTDALGRSDL